jgi:anti-sigma factor ChrR (cupin superfamily)
VDPEGTAPGCVVPWHSHTAEEQLIVIRGDVVAEMTNHPRTQLGPGGFAMMGSHTPHQFSCLGESTCLMIVTFDRVYDIYWGMATDVLASRQSTGLAPVSWTGEPTAVLPLLDVLDSVWGGKRTR